MELRTAFTQILSIAALLLFATGDVKAVSSSDLKKIEQKVQQQSIEHKKLQAQETQIILELSKINREMIGAAKKVQNSEEKLSLMEKRLEQLKSDLAEAEEFFSKEDDNLIKTLAALQNLALKPTEALFVQPLTPVETIRSAMLLRETVPYLEENASRIREELKIISQKKSLVERQIKQISKQKNILESEHSRMRALASRKHKMRSAVAIKSEKAKQNMKKLASQANDLRDLLTRIENQRLENKRKEEKAKLLAQKKLAEKKSDDLIKYQPPVITGKAAGFEQAKGSLPIPARGTIVMAYGEQVVKGVSAKGITIKTRNQAQVIAPFDGSVVFSGPFRGYGNLIIIEHGDGYLSLLAGLQSMDVEVGQMLLAGEPIGQMPSDGDAKLYLEIRKDNQPINPMAWIKV